MTVSALAADPKTGPRGGGAVASGSAAGRRAAKSQECGGATPPRPARADDGGRGASCRIPILKCVKHCRM